MWDGCTIEVQVNEFDHTGEVGMCRNASLEIQLSSGLIIVTLSLYG